MTRPETPKFTRGDAVVVRFRSDAHSVPVGNNFVVSRSGPKWVYVVRPHQLDADHERMHERSFQLADTTEGAPRTRVGYPDTLATPEQHAYDVETWKADRFIRERAGLFVEHGSPFRDRDRLVFLADLLREILPEAPSDA